MNRKTRCRPSKGRRCIPDVDIQVHVETYLNDFSSSAQVKIQVEFNFELFWKKNQFFWFPCCSTREDLSVDISVTYVGLILTKPGRFFFSAYGNSGYGQNSISSISNILKKFNIFGFPCCSTRENHSIDESITNLGLILTKLRWFQLFVKSQNLNFELFWNKNQIFGFPWCSNREDLSIDASITNVGLILTKLRWFQLLVKSQNSNFFEEKNFNIFGFPYCSTREDLSIDVSITYVGLIMTKLRWFQLFVKSQNSNFELFWKKNKIFGFPWCSNREDLSIDVSITIVGLKLTKLRWFQLFVKSQNLNFELFWNKNQIFGFPWCSTREDLFIDVSITIVGLILMKLCWYLFWGCGQTDRQTDRHDFGILTWKHVGTQKIST